MADLSYLINMIDPIILGICLCVGYVLKNTFSRFNNQNIPFAAFVLGTLLSVVIHYPNVNAEVVLGGMISGLASTGLYEMLRNLIRKDGKKGE